MTDFLSFLSDSDFTIDDSGEIILTEQSIQNDDEFVIDIPIRISSNCNTIIKSHLSKLTQIFFQHLQ